MTYLSRLRWSTKWWWPSTPVWCWWICHKKWATTNGIRDKSLTAQVINKYRPPLTYSSNISQWDSMPNKILWKWNLPKKLRRRSKRQFELKNHRLLFITSGQQDCKEIKCLYDQEIFKRHNNFLTVFVMSKVHNWRWPPSVLKVIPQWGEKHFFDYFLIQCNCSFRLFAILISCTSIMIQKLCFYHIKFYLRNYLCKRLYLKR